MKKLLMIIDYQYDFIADDGLLTLGSNAQNIENNILTIANSYIKNLDDIIFTLDTHIKEEWPMHPESKSFNLHCEKNTKGQQPFGKTKEIVKYKNCKIIEKKGYTPCINSIKKIINEYDNITLCGVVTNICIMQTAISLYNSSVNMGKNIKFFVDKNACTSFDENSHNFAIDYMKNILGFNIIN